MLILDLWGISFHAVVVFGLGKNLFFKSILGRCVSIKFPLDKQSHVYGNQGPYAYLEHKSTCMKGCALHCDAISETFTWISFVLPD